MNEQALEIEQRQNRYDCTIFNNAINAVIDGI